MLLALAIAGACWVLYTGLRARGAAAGTLEGNARLSALLDSGPALAMVVRADGRLELPDRLADWLGLNPAPRFLAELVAPGAGLTSEDAVLLGDAVTAAQRAGEPFNLAIRPQGSARTLIARGQRAPREIGSGGVVVWVFDATESQGQIGQLQSETADLSEAFHALRGLIEAAPLPMWYRGPDLKLAMVNSAYVAAVEAKDGRDVVQRQVELIEGAGTGGPIASAAAARDADKPGIKAMPATIGGARRMLRVHDVPLPSPPGGVAGFAIDIEDLEQARGGMKRFSDAQRAMLDRLSAGVAQFGADKTLSFCNQPFQRLFAMRGEWLADRPEFDRVLERMREASRLPEVRDFPGWKAERRDWFQANAAIEESWLLAGGTHLRVVANPLPDGGLLLIFEDRTEQVQLASARDTLLRVRTATFDNLFEALGVFAGDGRLQIWNNKFRQLWDFDEEFLASHPRIDALVEKGSAKLAQPGRATVIAELVRSAAVGRTQRAGRVAFADGRHFEFAGVPLPDGNALFTMLDISDSRRIETALRDRNDALEAADRVKTAFVANMSYELRTPLTSIQGFAEMLGEGYAGKLSKQADGYVDAILESVARLSALVDDVLALTETDQDKLERATVDLESVALTAAEAVAPLAKRKSIDFAIEVAPSTGTVKGDAKTLRQMVEHMLRHAVGGTGEGGRVLLHTDGDGAGARIVVSDDGAGMDQAAIDHAFDRFAEHDSPDDDRALGLGLPIARQFAEAHGGTIQLLSEPGAGTLLTVELPR